MAPTLRARKSAAGPAPASAPTDPSPKTSKSQPVPKKKTATAATSAAKGKAAALGASQAKAAPKPKTAKAAPKPAAAKAPAKAAPKPADTKAPAKSKPVSKGRKAASAMTPIAPVLDHQAYPHIFDSIVSSAPHASLLALRAASHVLLKRCDALLARHIVLGPGFPPPKGKKWDATAPHLPRGPDKKRARQHRVRLSSALGELPGWVCDLDHVNGGGKDSCGEQCGHLRARWTKHFAYDTRVLDIHSWLHSVSKVGHAATLFHGIDTVRFYSYTTEPLPVSAVNVVMFTSFTPVDGVDGAEWNRVSSTPGAYLEYEVQRVVIHARFDCRRPTLTECWVNFPTQFSDQHWPTAVLIFEPEPGSPVEPNTEWKTTCVRPNGVLWKVVKLLRVGTITDFTIVGASEIPHQICGLSHDTDRSHDDFAAAIKDNVIEWIRHDYAGGYAPETLTEEREKAIRAQLRFLTNAQYRAEVGEAQWAIDAVRTVKLV